MKDIKQVRVFISSPGDLVRERDLAVEICEQISQDIGSIKDFVVEPVRWESHTISSKAERSQLAISEQIGEYDIYLGIMGYYFGSSTGAYASGTEEEFEDALRTNLEKGDPLIQFYFSAAKVNPDEIKMDQYALVKGFREKLKTEGVYYRKFEDLTRFQVLLRKGLTTSILKVLDTKASKPAHGHAEQVGSYEALRPYEVLRNLRDEFAKDPSVSSHFLIVEATKALERFSIRLETVGTKKQKVANALVTATKEVEKLNSGKTKSTSKALRSFKRMMDLMEEFTYWLSYEIPLMQKDFMVAMTDFQRGTLIIKMSPELDDSELPDVFMSAETTKGQLEILANAVLSSGEAIPESKELGDRWEGNRRIYRAITRDFDVFLRLAMETITTTKDSVLQQV